jgi:hypothetical protein
VSDFPHFEKCGHLVSNPDVSVSNNW